MPNYICPRCHYITDRRSSIKNHFNRKKVCKTIYSRISIKDCKEQLNYLKNVITNVVLEESEEQKEIKRLKEEIEKLQKEASTTNYITNNNNNTNNIIVIKFDVNNISTLIPDSEKLKCFRDKTYQAPPIEDFLKTIHFNPDYPQYHNIFKSDMNREWISMFDGDKIIKQPELFVDDIIKKIEHEIKYLLEKNIEYEPYYKGLKTHLDLMRDEEYKESLVKGVKLLIHNNKDVPSGTLKLMGVM